MDSSERLHARRPLVLVVLTAVVFFALDNGLFRSGLVPNVQTTASVAGHFAMVARLSIAIPRTEKKDVLVLGHSKVEACLSPKIFEQDNPDTSLRLVMGSSGGTTEKMWFYLLKHIDPNRDRYAAIVIPIDTYKTPPLETDVENQINVAQVLAPMLSAADWRDLASTYTDPNLRQRVIAGALVSSHLYAYDTQDLLLHPQKRYETLEWAKKTAPTYLYNWDGYDGDLEGFEIDRKTAKIIQAPKHLDPFRRAEAEVRFREPAKEHVWEWTRQYHAFRERWLGRIIDYYAGSATKLVFVQMPRWPFDMPLLMPIPGAPSITDHVKPSANVVVLPEEEFEDLETPYYFYDVLHVNKRARAIFTKRFAKDLRAALGDLK